MPEEKQPSVRPLAAGDGALDETPSRRQTILVVDGEEIVRKTIGFIFQQRTGYKVVGAIDGRQAQAIFASHASELALLIVEITLPKLSGPDFVNHLPTLAPRIPVLFITGMGGYEVPGEISRQFPVLQKPFKADALLTAVKPFLQA